MLSYVIRLGDTPKIAYNRLLEKHMSFFRFTYLEEYYTDRRSEGIKI